MKLLDIVQEFQTDLKKLCDKYYIYDFGVVAIFKTDPLSIIEEIKQQKDVNTIKKKISHIVQYYDIKRKHAEVICDLYNAILMHMRLENAYVEIDEFYPEEYSTDSDAENLDEENI